MGNSRKNIGWTLAGAAVLLWGVAAFGQAIDGVVSDYDTGALLDGVSVTLSAEADGAVLGETTTDADGAYSVTAPDANAAVQLALTKAGYGDKTYTYLYAPRTMNVSLRSLKPAPPYEDGFLAMGGRERVYVTWEPNTEPDIAGYNVYRNGIQVNAGLVPDTWFIDPIAEVMSTIYAAYTVYDLHYSLTAVNDVDIESNPTGPVEATVGEIVVWINSTEMPRSEAGETGWVRVPVNVFTADFAAAAMNIAIGYPTEFFDAAYIERTPMTEHVAWEVGVGKVLEPGQVAVSALAMDAAWAIKGQGRLVDLYLRLSETAPVDDCGIIEFIELTHIPFVTFYDQDVQPIPVNYANYGEFCYMEDPVETCLLGDVNADGIVDSEDVRAAQQIAVQIIDMVPPEWDPTACMWKAADLNGDQRVDSGDAILINRIAAGMDIGLPAGTPGKALPKGIRTVTVASVDATANGDAVTVEISVDDESLLSGFDVTIAFEADENLLVLESAAEGTLLTDDFTLTPNTSTAGTVVVAASSTVALTGTGGGVLATLTFQVPASAPVGTVFTLNLADVDLKGELGDAFDQSTAVIKVDGQITVTAVVAPEPGEGEGEGEGEGTGPSCLGGTVAPPSKPGADMLLLTLAGLTLLAAGIKQRAVIVRR